MSYMGKVRPTIALLTDDIADDQVTSAKIADTTIVDADVNASAAIAKTKLASLDVVNADVNASAAIVQSKLATLAIDTAELVDNGVTLGKLEDGTQGDILYYGASGAPARLGFGTSGDFLKTQGTGANPVWASAGGANTPFFQAGKSTTDTIYTSNTWVKVTFDDELIDTDGDYDPTTNYRFTPTTAGKYFIGSVFTISSTKVGYRYLATLYFNGANNRDAEWSLQSESAGNESSLYTSLILTFNGSSDYVESYFRNESDVTVSLVSTASKFWGYKLIE